MMMRIMMIDPRLRMIIMIIMMIMLIYPCGQLGLWASLFGGARLYDVDDNKPVWPTWAVGDLFRDARCIHIN
jgi:hypothetical protein